MGIFSRLFKKPETQIKTIGDFWLWFKSNSGKFYDILDNQRNVENNFINVVSEKLIQLNEGFYILTGMYDNNTAELIVTADGNIKNFPLVNELIDLAPHINGWKFTALKPSHKIEDTVIQLKNKTTFSKENLFFYPEENNQYPDEIDIKIIFEGDSTNEEEIEMGVFIFLENYLGELNFAEDIDLITILDKSKATKELIPIEKLKSYVHWRKKEFIEKYEPVFRDTKEDTFSMAEMNSEDNLPLLAIFNSDVAQWENKTSHPWIAYLNFSYDGSQNNGLPLPDTYEILNKIEQEIDKCLKSLNGYINLGRVTGNNEKEIFIACKDYNKPAIEINKIINRYPNIQTNFEIYPDKYWRSLERFHSSL